MSDRFAPLPEGPFSVLLADPPWRYGFTKVRAWGIDVHYPTLAPEEIAALPVGQVAARDAVLFLWATSPKLPEALSVMTAWGFTYKTSMVWEKNGLGMGYYARINHELLLIGARGSLPVPPPPQRPASVIHARRRRHSQKPEETYQAIEQMYPDAPRLELFARDSRAGWASWGDEVRHGA